MSQVSFFMSRISRSETRYGHRAVVGSVSTTRQRVSSDSTVALATRFMLFTLRVMFPLPQKVYLSPLKMAGLNDGPTQAAAVNAPVAMWPAVLASAAFRALFHLPFGINAMLSIFALGLIFGLVYWRWRQLWPLIVAHSLADMLTLFYGSYHAT